jgi:D-aminoacyl-tRNA deacylase
MPRGSLCSCGVYSALKCTLIGWPAIPAPMRALIQRVSSASVTVDGEVAGEIGQGLVILLGVGEEDGPEEAQKLADKVARLRVFDGDDGRMDRSLLDLGAGALCISQFTLYGDTRRGLRPSFTAAAEPDRAERLYDDFCRDLERLGVHVERGRFGARMSVELVNEGPVTLMLEI